MNSASNFFHNGKFYWKRFCFGFFFDICIFQVTTNQGAVLLFIQNLNFFLLLHNQMSNTKKFPFPDTLLKKRSLRKCFTRITTFNWFIKWGSILTLLKKIKNENRQFNINVGSKNPLIKIHLNEIWPLMKSFLFNLFLIAHIINLEEQKESDDFYLVILKLNKRTKAY